jgi:subtilase family serine protease
MKNFAQRFRQYLFSPARLSFPISLLTSAVLATVVAPAQGQASSTVRPRIAAEVNANERAQLPNSKLVQAKAQFDAGRLAASTRLQGVSLYFNRTQSQEAALKALLAAQQTPGSAQYHQWLTPEQFASRFGMADADIAKVQGWLEQQGFSVDSTASSKNAIHFSGTVAQIESAFSTEMHNYNIPTSKGVEKHFAPSTALSVPSALAGVVLGVRNLDDFRPKSHIVVNKTRRPKPAFTQSGTGYIFFAPGDISLEYDVAPVYKAGFTGAGQSIAIVGQSQIVLTDIEAFQNAAGLTVKDPTTYLVENSGSATTFSGDETESDLDLEWSGALAPGAAINLVFTGNGTNYGAFDAILYAIDKKIGTIISTSYGNCEPELAGTELATGGATITTLESAFEQAAVQGQTVLSAAGDDGSTDCFTGSTGGDNPPVAEQEELSVDYPASSAYVTGVGGTEISQANAAYETPGSAFWESAGGSDVISSLLQYVPEQAWNEDENFCLYYLNQGDGGSPICAGGGGASSLFNKPSWQAGVPGIPTDGKRDVPDVSLNAAIYNPGYLFCSSDTSDWQSGQQSSCTSGFEDSATEDLTVAGGTSFATPIFAGMVALINQQQGYTTGQGLINPALYQLASNTTTYASAFHDIKVGDNECDAGSTYCSGTIGFTAGAGYDQATGLGSVDLSSLASAWPASTGPSLIGTTTTVSASNTAPTINTSDTFTITVTPSSGSGVPSGTVSITVDSGTPVTGTLTANGTYTYTTSFTTSGAHQVVASYSGDSTYAASTGSVTVNVPVPVSGTGTFKLTATNVTVAQGSQGSSTITVTPAGGYTGTVELTFDTSNDNALQNLCVGFANQLSNGDGSVAISNATMPATTQLTFDTNAADCAGDAVGRTGKHQLRARHQVSAGNTPGGKGGLKTTSAELALAGLLLVGFLGRSSRESGRKLRGLACLLLLTAAGMAMSACGGSNSNTVADPPKGTYTVTVTGQDTTSASIPIATTTFTFTID